MSKHDHFKKILFLLDVLLNYLIWITMTLLLFLDYFIKHHSTKHFNKLYNNRAAKKEAKKKGKKKTQTNKRKKAKYQSSTWLCHWLINVSLRKWIHNTVLLSASEHQKLKGSKNLSVTSAEELPVEKHLEHLLSFHAPQNFNETIALVYELI